MVALLITTLSFAQALSGTYKVGVTEVAPNFASLGAAVTALNTNGVAGDVILEITSDITEAANIGLGVNTNGFGITIRPDVDADRKITFTQLADNTSPTGHFVIGYPTSGLTAAWSDANTIATSNVIIDGYALGGTTRRLTFTNTNASHTNARMIMVVGACQNTVIKNCIINNLTTHTGSPFCVGAVVRKGAAIEVAPSNFTIENNILTCTASTVGMGMRITNSGTLGGSVTVTGFVCKNNIISAQRRILEMNYTNGGQIYGNTISLVQPNSTALGYGIWTATGCAGTFNIYNNKFIASSCSGSDTAAGGQRVLSLGGSVTCNVYNNMFAGMDRAGTATGAVNQTYCFFGCAGKIYNNTFYMPALTVKTNTGYYTAIQLSFSNPEIKNNIFISNEDAMVNAFYSAVTTGVSDFNVFYNRVGNTKALFVSGTATSTFAAYQAAYPTKDKNSKNVDVNFVSSTDLTPTGSSIGDPNLATPRIPTVLTDIAGTSRAALTYAGAFEASDMTAIAKQFTVTVPNGTQKVYITGDFTGKSWDNTDPLQLTAQTTANVFSGIFPCVDGVNYKYLCEKGDWEYQDASSVNPLTEKGNRTYSASDVVDFWKAMPKVTLNVTFASGQAIPTNLYVKGSWDSWASPVTLTKSGDTYSGFLGGNTGDKIYSNTEYKYYTNDMVTDNWEVFTGNRWAIYPTMTDEIASFTTPIPATAVDNTSEMNVRIMRTASGVTAVFDGNAAVELYNMNGALIEKTTANGSYSRDLSHGAYIIRINGISTKFVK